MYKHILIPTDGSPCSDVAISQGLTLAKKLEADVTFLYAVDNPLTMVWIDPQAIPYRYGLEEDLLKAGSEALERAKAQAQTVGVTAQVQLVRDTHPVDAICEAAKTADLVLMGSHGRRGFDRLIMGSVTEAVFRRSEKPLLVVNCRTQD